MCNYENATLKDKLLLNTANERKNICRFIASNGYGFSLVSGEVRDFPEDSYVYYYMDNNLFLSNL